MSRSWSGRKRGDYVTYRVYNPATGHVHKTSEEQLSAEKGSNVYDENTVRRLLRQGFDVYIFADHGNTWCMLLAAYPVFQDVTRLIGKITKFQDEFTVKQLRQKPGCDGFHDLSGDDARGL